MLTVLRGDAVRREPSAPQAGDSPPNHVAPHLVLGLPAPRAGSKEWLPCKPRVGLVWFPLFVFVLHRLEKLKGKSAGVREPSLNTDYYHRLSKQFRLLHIFHLCSEVGINTWNSITRSLVIRVNKEAWPLLPRAHGAFRY